LFCLEKTPRRNNGSREIIHEKDKRDTETVLGQWPEKRADTCRQTATCPQPCMQELHTELRRSGVTPMLLWQEYKEKFPEGYQYSQFCEHYRTWAKTLDLSLRQEYRDGEKLFVDYTGTTIPLVNSFTGQITEAEIFVAVLGASNYTYAEAMHTEPAQLDRRPCKGI
jgi:transposase